MASYANIIVLISCSRQFNFWQIHGPKSINLCMISFCFFLLFNFVYFYCILFLIILLLIVVFYLFYILFCIILLVILFYYFCDIFCFMFYFILFYYGGKELPYSRAKFFIYRCISIN